jgi:hypothetical protein
MLDSLRKPLSSKPKCHRHGSGNPSRGKAVEVDLLGRLIIERLMWSGLIIPIKPFIDLFLKMVSTIKFLDINELVFERSL